MNNPRNQIGWKLLSLVLCVAVIVEGVWLFQLGSRNRDIDSEPPEGSESVQSTEEVSSSEDIEPYDEDASWVRLPAPYYMNAMGSMAGFPIEMDLSEKRLGSGPIFYHISVVGDGVLRHDLVNEKAPEGDPNYFDPRTEISIKNPGAVLYDCTPVSNEAPPTKALVQIIVCEGKEEATNYLGYAEVLIIEIDRRWVGSIQEQVLFVGEEWTGKTKDFRRNYIEYSFQFTAKDYRIATSEKDGTNTEVDISGIDYQNWISLPESFWMSGVSGYPGYPVNLDIPLGLFGEKVQYEIAVLGNGEVIEDIEFQETSEGPRPRQPSQGRSIILNNPSQVCFRYIPTEMEGAAEKQGKAFIQIIVFSSNSEGERTYLGYAQVFVGEVENRWFGVVTDKELFVDHYWKTQKSEARLKRIQECFDREKELWDF